MADNGYKIHVSNLKKNFGKLEVLRDISLDVREGEVVVLIGPSGSGKSTLLRCLNQLETATGGQIVIDGHDVTDKHTDINKVRQNIGMVFQHFNLFNHLNVMDNMILAPVHLKLMTKEQARGGSSEASETRRPGGQGGGLSQPAFRRAEAACGDCPRAGDEAGYHVVRRADQRSGSGDGRRSAGGHERTCQRRHDDGSRYP